MRYGKNLIPIIKRVFTFLIILSLIQFNLPAISFAADSDFDGLDDVWEMQYFGNLDQGPWDDPDEDLLLNLEELRGNTNPTQVDGNLVLNSGFEDGAQGNGSPVHWNGLDLAHQSLDQSEHFEGSTSWKWIDTTNVGAPYAESETIAVEPNQNYLLSTYIKSSPITDGVRPTILFGWVEGTRPSGCQSDSCTTFGNVNWFVSYNREIPEEWTRFFATWRTDANTNVVSLRMVMNYNIPTITSDRSIWLDHFTVIQLNPTSHLLPAYGCENTATSRCVDFGENESPSGVSMNTEVMSDISSETDPTDGHNYQYRSLNPQQTLVFEVDAFNSDSEGFPLSDMLLEIKYKDVLDVQDNPLRLAKISTKLDHYNLNQSDYPWIDPVRDFPVGNIGRNWGSSSGTQWKYLQIAFGKTNYQLIRAINGKFTIKIEMPMDPSVDVPALPIDYIRLSTLTSGETDMLHRRHAEAKGFREIELPIDQPSPPASYSNPNFTVFTRDIMRPIYLHTKPASSEITNSLSKTSAQREMAIMNFGVYSQAGIPNLTPQISALTNANTGDIIPQADIELYYIENDMKHTNPQWEGEKRFAILPDYLVPASASVTVDPETSKRFVVMVDVPDTAAGTYQGVLNLGQDITISINLTVLPIALDPSKHMNPIYHDPQAKVFANTADEVFELYRKMDLDPYVNIQDVDDVVEILDRRIANGFLRGRMIANVGGLLAASYFSIYGERMDRGNPFGGIDLYARLSSPALQNSFETAIQEIMDLAAARNITVLFDISDEPCKHTTVTYQRLVTDRGLTMIKHAGGETSVTANPNCFNPTEPSTVYIVPGDGTLPALIPTLIDYPVWNQASQTLGYNSGFDHFGYYTTNTSYLAYPIYARFVAGWLAEKTNADIVSQYAMGDIIGDPYQDFDGGWNSLDNNPGVDFVLAYPSWRGPLLKRLAMVGILLGIQDSKYIATLERLIAENPNHPSADDASNFLVQVKDRLSSNFWTFDPDNLGYADIGNRQDNGFYGTILEDVSETGNSEDFEAFSDIQNQIIDYIQLFHNQPPTAHAGSDQTYTLGSGQTTVDVTLNGSASSDPDSGDSISLYEWTGAPDPQDVVQPVVNLPEGIHHFNLRVKDSHDVWSENMDQVTITVNPSQPPPVQYSLNVTAENGSISLNPPGGLYNPGTEVTLTAVSNTGYHFVSWQGSISSVLNPVTLTMDSDKNVAANFEQDVNNPQVNTPPIVNAGEDQTVHLGNSVTLRGTASDDGLPTGGVLSVSWVLTSGAASVTFVNMNALETQVNFSTIGSYTFELRVNDSEISSSDQVQVMVSSVATDDDRTNLPIGNNSGTQQIPGTTTGLESGSIIRITRNNDPTSNVRNGSPQIFSENGSTAVNPSAKSPVQTLIFSEEETTELPDPEVTLELQKKSFPMLPHPPIVRKEIMPIAPAQPVLKQTEKNLDTKPAIEENPKISFKPVFRLGPIRVYKLVAQDGTSNVDFKKATLSGLPKFRAHFVPNTGTLVHFMWPKKQNETSVAVKMELMNGKKIEEKLNLSI